MSTTFFKSTYSGANNSCVEVAHRPDSVLIRDSKYTGPEAERPIVSVSPDVWSTFLRYVVSADSAELDDVAITVHSDGAAMISGQGQTLMYTPAEWDAFIKGVADGEFDRLSA